MLIVVIVSVELGGFLYAVGGMDSPRAGFWGAPLNTGHFILMIILSFTFSIVIVLILQSSATVHGPMSGRQLHQCTSPGLLSLSL